MWKSSSFEVLTSAQVDVEDQEFGEEFLSQEDPSMLHFLLASGEEVKIPLPSLRTSHWSPPNIPFSS